MRTLLIALAFLAAACSEKNEIAEKVEARADKRADAMEEASRSMTNALQQNGVAQQAETVREAGEERAEAIRDSELKPGDLTDEQEKSLIKGDEGTPGPSQR